MTQRSDSHRLTLVLITLALVLTPLLAVSQPQQVAAAGVVSECTEPALRAALAGGGLVTFSCSGTIPIASQLEITDDTIIDGGGQVTLDGGGVTRLLRVNSGVSLTVRGLTLTGGFSTGIDGGSAILNFGNLMVEASTLSGNSADFGGAIDNYGVMTLAASALSGNSARFGGAIYINPNSTATITAGTLSGNSAGRDGGAIYNNGGTLTVTASTFTDNSAGFGGAIENVGTLTVTASTFTGNDAAVGGAIRTNVGTLTVTASTFTGNSANFGGAIDNVGTPTVTASTFTGNSAEFGGAIYNLGTITLTASTFTDNSANFGGAIYNASGSRLSIVASTLTGNSADNAGGAIRNFNGTTTVLASTLAGNVAGVDGGAIAHNGGTVTLTASILSGTDLCGSQSVSSAGYNVASDATCNLTGTDDLESTDPLLDDLRDNGGPTLTMLPENESPAIDRVPNALCATLSAANDGRDQRGAPRPDGDADCDSGAAEAGTLVYAWLLATYASPSTILERQSATLTAVASGPVSGELQYSFVCPGNPVGPQDSPQTTCFFPEPGAFEIEITVSESGPPVNSDNGSVTVTVDEVEVVANLTPADDTFAEGDSYIGTGSFTTNGVGPWTATVDYGDGSGPQPLDAITPGTAIPITRQYLLAGDYTITLEVCDTGVNRCGEAQASVTVTEAQVVVTLDPPVASVGEGSSYEGTGSFTTDGFGPWSATVDYGDGSAPQDLFNVAPTIDFSISHQYLAIGDYTITLEICDTLVNRCGAAQASVTVTAVAPSVTLTPVSLNLGQGDTFQASGSFTDPGLGPWTATVDYGQGGGPQPLPIDPGNTFSLSRVYLQQGSFTVTVQVCDAVNACGSASVIVQVGNVAPVIQTVATNRDGARITVRVVASDPGGGPLTYSFSCAGQVIGPQVSPTASCDFGNQTGQFALLVEVTDANQVTVSETVVVEIPTYLCVGERSGTPRYMGNPGGCVRGEQPLVLTSDGSWSFCVGERSGSLRYLFSSNTNCLRGEWQLTLPEQGPISICVGERSQSMRYVANAASCNPRGELVYRIANRVAIDK